MDIEAQVVVGTGPTTVSDVVAIADGARVVLDEAARVNVDSSRRVLLDAVAQGRPVYGVTAGLGHTRDRPIPFDQVRAMQAPMVRMHAGGIGAPLPARVVRAAMAARVVGLSGGGSGASTALVDSLIDLLNHDIVPVVPAVASVGAADLGHMAHIGLVAMGEGRALVRGVVTPAHEALASAGIEPLQLEPKDGLALLSANAVTLGHGALVLDRLEDALARADLVCAVSMDAARANPSVLDPAVQEAKGSSGQMRSAAGMREQLRGSARIEQPASLQDALSFRVAPQVHGACRDVLETTRAALETELNARTDNPLTTPDGRVVSNGNFAPVLVALMFDAARVGLAHLAQLSDRRLGKMWDATVETAFAADRPGPGSAQPLTAGLQLRYPAAARYSEARRLANPVTLDVPTLDRGQEDHATNAPAAVHTTDLLLDVVMDVLAVELLMAYRHFTAAPSPRTSRRTAMLFDALGDLSHSHGNDALAPEVHRQVRDLLVAMPVLHP